VTDFDGDNLISASDIKVGLDLIVNYQDDFTRVRPPHPTMHTPRRLSSLNGGSPSRSTSLCTV
jgi:hypothetical protein